MKLLNSLPEIIIVKGTKLKLQVGDKPSTVRQHAKKNKLKYKTVFCLSRNLRGKTDLHGRRRSGFEC